MLRSAGIRSKILAVLVVPLVLLGITAGLLAAAQVDRARQAYEVEKIAAIGADFATLVRGIAAERATTAAVIQDDPAAAEALPQVRAQVDEGLLASREAVADVRLDLLSGQAEEALARVQSAHVELGIIRQRVDGGGASLDDVMADFDDVLREDLAMPGRVAAGVADEQTADLLAGFGHLMTTRDLALQEQEIGRRILARSATVGDTRTFGPLAEAQTEEIASWEFAVGSTAAADAAELVGDQRQTVWSIGRARVALSSPSTVTQTGLTQEVWQETTEARVAGLETALTQIAGEVDTQAAAVSQRATLLAALAVAAAVVGVGVTVLLSLVLARRIARPLRELTAAATSVREQLPRMVEQMRSPGQMPDVTLPRIEVDGDDEVARLAAAFNDVNATVVEVAEEQAALRGSIAETFVNVARRNQVLLSRQLSFIDQLEQTEENPDTLENLFRLDHLATRMRRNAESLLVLANIDAGRRLRQPLALSDVIRTAASEIEQYERINLALQVDPPTMGHLSLQLAHLLAELLENGTNFSEPHTPVLVATSKTATGIRITVTDEGLGLNDEEIEAANAKISDFGADDVVTSQRLGFFVVGRLARRLGVTVGIRRGAAKGLVVTVDLPPSLFVPGTVKVVTPEAPAVTAAPAPVATPSRQAPSAPPATSRPAAPAQGARPPTPRPATPAPTPRTPGTPIPLPSAPADEEAAPAVTVTPGGPALPRRGQAAPASAGAGTAAAGTAAPPATAAPAAPAARVPTPPAPSPAAPVTPGPAFTAPRPEDDTAALTPVVSGDGPTLPTRARRTPAPVETPAPVPVATPAPAARTAPAADRTEVSAPAAPVSEGDVPGGPGGHPGAPPRRAGLFGAFRARREVEADGSAAASSVTGGAPVTPGVAPSGPAPVVGSAASSPSVTRPSVAPVPDVAPPATRVPAPATTHAPPAHSTRPAPTPATPQAATPQAAAPTVAPAPVAQAPVPPAPAAQAPAARAPQAPAAQAPAAQASAAQAPAARAPQAPAAQARVAQAPAAPAPVTRRSAPEPAPATPAAPPRPTSQPVDILPGGGRRRGRRSLFGGRQAAAQTPTPPVPDRVATPTPPAVPAAAPASTRPDLPQVPNQNPGPARRPAGPVPEPAAAVATGRSDAPAAPLPGRPGGQAAPVSLAPALDDGDSVRQRSMLASEALSELSRLSTYSPSAVEGRSGPAPLTRRQPAASEAAKIHQPTGPAPERRQRSAADVRSMLSGFQSGVTRGRGEDADASVPPPAQSRVPVPSGASGAEPALRPAVPPARTSTHPSTDDTRTTD